MKKIIIIALTVILMLGIMCLFVGARDETNYERVVFFDNTKKCYPLMASLEDAIGFFEYYQTDNLLLESYLYPDTSTGIYFRIEATKNNVRVEEFTFDSEDPVWIYNVPQANTYEDIAIIVKRDGRIYSYILCGSKYGEWIELVKINDIPPSHDTGEPISHFSSFTISLDELESEDFEGWYVEFPIPIGAKPNNIVKPIVDGSFGFVTGLGSVFPNAFNVVFLENGKLNSLSIFVLTMCGVAFGYGIVRFITYLFRKKGD